MYCMALRGLGKEANINALDGKSGFRVRGE
jgi:hypothetical protein